MREFFDFILLYDIIIKVRKLEANMNFIQKIIQRLNIKRELNCLEYYKQTLKSSGTLEQGLEYILRQFDMSIYIINRINRCLIIYTGESNCLSPVIEKLENLKSQFIIEKREQEEELNLFNIEQGNTDENESRLLTTNEEFIFNYDLQISKLQEEAHNLTYKILYISNTKTPHKNLVANYLSTKELDVLTNNQDSYALFFTFENVLRKYILEKYKEKYGCTDLSNWIKQEDRNEFSKRKNDENKFGISSRGDHIIYYLDFDIFAKIIQNNFKDGFNDDFKRIDDIVPKLNYLYYVRCKIAHNSLCVNDDEYKISADYITILLKQLSHKYKL